jgi:elongation factor Ts
MTISMDDIKKLRDMTGVSTMACKKALEEASSDLEKAVELLRKRGEAKAVERSERSASQGVVASYVHSNLKLGVLVQVNCETDFVARNEDFGVFAKDVAMHIAAMNPLYIRPEEVPNELVEKEREIWKAQLAAEKKPESVIMKIMEGKEKKFREEVSLLTQPFVKNPDVSVSQLLIDMASKMGENIQIARFTRFSL